MDRKVWADPPWREGLPLSEREVRAWVRRVEHLRRRLLRALGDEEQARAGRRVAELRVARKSDDSRSTWQGFNVERTLTDLRGVDNFERFLSSKHFIRGPPRGMFYCMKNRNENVLRNSRGVATRSLLKLEGTRL